MTHQETLAARFPSASVFEASRLEAEWIGTAVQFGSLTFVVYQYDDATDLNVDVFTDDDVEATCCADLSAVIDLIAARVEF